MATVTIPKKLAGKGDLVVIPKKEYESLMRLKAMKGFTPTIADRRALAVAENNLKRNKTLSYNELVHRLGFAN